MRDYYQRQGFSQQEAEVQVDAWLKGQEHYE
jgi:hypothetical protein